MKSRDWLQQNEKALAKENIATARLDCLVLLEDVTGKDRGWLLSHPEFELQGLALKILSTKIAQRARHIPLAYIRSKAEFYGREFTVNEHTLVPRPETETMIDMLKIVRNLEADVAAWQVERRGRKTTKKQYIFEKSEPASSLIKSDEGYKVVWQKPARTSQRQPRPPIHGQNLRYHDEDLCLVDVGTGSGAIAITAKLEIPDATVIGTDIDKKCLETARNNAQSLGADIQFVQGGLLEPLHLPSEHIVVLLCNLPYVPDNFQINTAATHEPRHALFGGADGLDLYRELFTQTNSLTVRPFYILTESLPPQHKMLSDIAKASGYKLSKTNDFIQLFEADISK